MQERHHKNAAPIIHAVVFDFDGTLAELTVDFDLMKRRLLNLLVQFAPEIQPINTLPALELVAEAERHIRSSRPEAAQSFIRKSMELIKDMEMEGARKGRLFAGTPAMLDALKDLRIQTAIITRNCSDAVLAVLPDLEDHVSCFLSRDHVDKVKPDPSHLLQAVERLGCTPEKTLMVGDHPMDIETGRKAGTRTAAVAGGRISLSELEDCGPDAATAEPAELLNMIRETFCLHPLPELSHEEDGL